VTHSAYVYLLYSAHFRWKLECEAHARGETVRVRPHFTTLPDEPGVQVSAQIYRLSADRKPEIAFTVRFDPAAPPTDERLVRMARVFFGDRPYVATPATARHGYGYRSYVCEDVPPSVIALA
jgi:hypothetical protein